MALENCNTHEARAESVWRMIAVYWMIPSSFPSQLSFQIFILTFPGPSHCHMNWWVKCKRPLWIKLRNLGKQWICNLIECSPTGSTVVNMMGFLLGLMKMKKKKEAMPVNTKGPFDVHLMKVKMLLLAQALIFSISGKSSSFVIWWDHDFSIWCQLSHRQIEALEYQLWLARFVTWENQGCHDAKQLYEYLDHPNVSAVFTTTHQSAIEPHPKVYSLPLGVFSAARATEELHAQPQMMNRSQLLMINFNSDTAYSDYGRLKIEKSVIANFNGTLKNTYNTGGQALYWQELRQSKFVLCPSGLGWDTYRSWEALVMGAIPVLETFYRKDGFYRTYDDLPVLWVDHYDNVTPSLLEEAYPKILSRAQKYKFEKLTRQFWLDLVLSHLDWQCKPSPTGPQTIF